MRSSVNVITKTIDKYLEKHSLSEENPSWKIKKSSLGGYGLFTTRAIKPGEVIFKDYPVLIGPRCGPATPPICKNCYNKKSLKFCERKCGLQLCSIECQNSSSHIKECKIIRQWASEAIPEEFAEKITRILLPIRSLLLSDEDKEVIKCLKAHRSVKCSEIDFLKDTLRFDIKDDEEVFLRFVYSVLDANAFEVTANNEDHSSIKGLYSLTSLVNHCCTPNAFYVFDKHQRIIVRASNFIPKESEIFYSYARFIWGTPTRRLYLYKTKQFICKCDRCVDPTEFGSYISAFLCKFCKKGRVIPSDPLVSNGKWRCEECFNTTASNDIAILSSSFGSILNSFSDADINCLLKLVEKKFPNLVDENHEIIVTFKYKIIWILGHKTGFTWPELSDDLLHTKVKFCKELLALLEKLRLGQCKMRGLLLYELYSCFKETRRREEKSGNVSKMLYDEEKKIFLEAANILMFDAAAPNEVQNIKWFEKCEET